LLDLALNYSARRRSARAAAAGLNLKFSGASNKQTHTQAHRSTRAANHGRGAAKRKGAGMKIIDMEGLLVRLVDNLVSSSASEVSEGDEVLKTQAHFYRVLISSSRATLSKRSIN
jgi:hypothetical protein